MKIDQTARPSLGLSEKLRDLQAQRDAGIIPVALYRRLASEAVNAGMIDSERSALTTNTDIQSLTGFAGILVETNCREPWHQAVLKRWAGVKHKKLILALAFVTLVATISVFAFYDEETAVDVILDQSAGHHEANAIRGNRTRSSNFTTARLLS